MGSRLPVLDQDPNLCTHRIGDRGALAGIRCGRLFGSVYLPMNGASEEGSEKRREFWEHAYTLFESLALIWELEVSLITAPEIGTVSEYAAYLNKWTAFFAHLGRIHDMVTRLSAMKAGAGAETLQDSVPEELTRYFQARNIVLHGPKVPMRRVDSILYSPELGEAPRQWTDKKMRWRDMKDADFMAVAEYVVDNLKELEPVLDVFFARAFSILPGRLGFKPVVWPFQGVRAFSVADMPGSDFEGSRGMEIVDMPWTGGSGIAHAPGDIDLPPSVD